MRMRNPGSTVGIRWLRAGPVGGGVDRKGAVATGKGASFDNDGRDGCLGVRSCWRSWLMRPCPEWHPDAGAAQCPAADCMQACVHAPLQTAWSCRIPLRCPCGEPRWPLQSQWCPAVWRQPHEWLCLLVLMQLPLAPRGAAAGGAARADGGAGERRFANAAGRKRVSV